MEAIRQFVRIPANHKLFIDVPKNIAAEQLAEVILIIREPAYRKDKIKNLKMSVNDQIFLDDLKEVEDDFKAVDSREW